MDSLAAGRGKYPLESSDKWSWAASQMSQAYSFQTNDKLACLPQIKMKRSGKPNLAQYKESLSHYVRQYQDGLAVLNGIQSGNAREAYRQRVEATWGLIAKGADAIPFALEMLKSKFADAREDAGGILGELGGDETIVSDLLVQLKRESDNQARDSLILALGQMRSRKAIPTLGAIICNSQEDGDTRWTAIESLGRIVRRRFLRQADPEQAAKDWLAKHATES